MDALPLYLEGRATLPGSPHVCLEDRLNITSFSSPLPWQSDLHPTEDFDFILQR